MVAEQKTFPLKTKHSSRWLDGFKFLYLKLLCFFCVFSRNRNVHGKDAKLEVNVPAGQEAQAEQKVQV